MKDDAIKFLRRLTDANECGAIVSSGVCSVMEITFAQQEGRFWVDPETSCGYVLRLKRWREMAEAALAALAEQNAARRCAEIAFQLAAGPTVMAHRNGCHDVGVAISREFGLKWPTPKSDSTGDCNHKWTFVKRGDPDEAEVEVDVLQCSKCGVYQERPYTPQSDSTDSTTQHNPNSDKLDSCQTSSD